MENIEKSIREEARKLLGDKSVDVIIGYESGIIPLRSAPSFIYKIEDTDKLVWNSFCENNLARFTMNREDKIGIIAKGCDSRSLMVLLKEKQIKRENLKIIGVPCHGMIDRHRIEREFSLEGKEILEAIEKGEEIILKGPGFERAIKKADYLFISCQLCRHRNPVIYDLLSGEMAAEREEIEDPLLRSFEAMSPDERWDYFLKEISRCIRCYACRDACPNCYCPECFVDTTQPQWFGTSQNISDLQMYHIVRAFHQAGRCVDCGACSRACPMGIDLRLLLQKLNLDVRNLFDYEAGLNLEKPAPLQAYNMEDSNEFFK
ncbi:MAG: 4Fe-4S dicluster domain-containing protein [Nitrospirota bacterium]